MTKLPPNEFKRAVVEGRMQLGLWSSLCSNIAAEVIAGAGFDWILVDTVGLLARHSEELAARFRK